MQWQPIETAPKDGTPVDLFITADMVSKGWRAIEYHWDAAASDWVDSDKRPLSDAYANTGVRATHWMPVPVSPAIPANKCPLCDGTGFVTQRLLLQPGIEPSKMQCGICRGTGVLPKSIFKIDLSKLS